jgi:2-C-methyl-D-erythritol 4-phosphate cytidylyltransferase
MLPKYVIITAGGSGVRMNTPLPKQFLLLLGKPVLMQTIEAFIRFQADIHIIIVLPRDQMGYWEDLCNRYNFKHPCKIEEGGPTRFHSVKNGLKHVPENALVAIHDGVRPLVSDETITNAFFYAEKFGNGIPTIGIAESVRFVDHAHNKPINRDSLRIIQTPQCFKAELIKQAFNTSYDESFTDDASVLEKMGERIYLSQGNKENIKITTPEDLLIAEAILKKNRQEKTTDSNTNA